MGDKLWNTKHWPDSTGITLERDDERDNNNAIADALHFILGRVTIVINNK